MQNQCPRPDRAAQGGQVPAPNTHSPGASAIPAQLGISRLNALRIWIYRLRRRGIPSVMHRVRESHRRNLTEGGYIGRGVAPRYAIYSAYAASNVCRCHLYLFRHQRRDRGRTLPDFSQPVGLAGRADHSRHRHADEPSGTALRRPLADACAYLPAGQEP